VAIYVNSFVGLDLWIKNFGIVISKIKLKKA